MGLEMRQFFLHSLRIRAGIYKGGGGFFLYRISVSQGVWFQVISKLKTQANMKGSKIIISCFLFCRKQISRFHTELVKILDILTYRATYRS